MTRPEARIALGAAGILSLDEAAELLGGRRETARAWLRERGLVRDVPGLGKRVLWGDVLDEIRLTTGPGATPPEPPRARLPRKAIRPRR